MKFNVYIAYNREYDKFYIGQTYDLDKRILEHNLGLSKYTAKYKGGWDIVYTETKESRAEAVRREKFLKRQKNKSFYKSLCQMDD